MTTILEPLDINLMTFGAKLFQGKHNFKSYCYKAKNNGLYTRTIITCELINNNLYEANFFPKKSYLLRVTGKGFGRHQIPPKVILKTKSKMKLPPAAILLKVSPNFLN